MSSTIVSARSLFFQKELHEDLIEVKSIFLFASLRTETSGLLRLRLLIPNGGYCFTMVVTALRWWLLLYVCAYSFSIRILLFYIFFILERERLSGRKSHPDPGIKKKSQFPIMMSNGGRGLGLLILVEDRGHFYLHFTCPFMRFCCDA